MKASISAKKADSGYVYVSDRLNLTVDSIKINRSQISDICSAYKNDLNKMTRADLEEGRVYCYIGDKLVLDSFSETKAFLEDIGYEPPEIDKSYIKSNIQKRINIITDYELVSYLSQNMTDNYLEYDPMNNTHNLNIESSMTNIGLVHSNLYDNYGSNFESLTLNSDESYATAAALLENATSVIIDEKPAAIIRIDNCMLYLKDTPENQAILAELE